LSIQSIYLFKSILKIEINLIYFKKILNKMETNNFDYKNTIITLK